MQATLYFTYGVMLLWAGSTLSDEVVDLRSILAQLQQLKQGQAEMRQENDALKQGQAEMRQENEALKQGQAKMKQENDALKQVQAEMKREVQHLHKKDDNLEIEVRQLQQGQVGGDIGRPPTNCVLGSNFLFDEYPDAYGGGVPYTLDNEENAYRCLDLCRQDPDCVAVSIEKDAPRTCSAYSDAPASIIPEPNWDYYQLVYSSSCWVDKPVVEFMASITYHICVNDNVLVVWDKVIYDSGDGMKLDGRFHCPVAGYYKLTLDVRTHDGASDIFSIRKNDQTQLALLSPNSADWDDMPGTVDVYTFCDVDDTVSVYGEASSSCMTGNPTIVYSSFSGRLV